MKHVLLLMSDTGGGHRAAAEAIRDALYLLYGRDAVRVDLVDVFKQSLFPLNYMPEFYPWIINNSKTSWGIGYNLANRPKSVNAISHGIYLTNGHRLRRMARSYPADVVVSVHSVITRPSMQAFSTLHKRPPFITVVTDLVSTPAFWYEHRVEKCFVPTREAFDRGLEHGMQAEQMEIVGLPVHPRFSNAIQEKPAARTELGWDQDLPAILLVAGGEGMGPLYETARAINDMRLRCQIIIVAGKNELLKSRLQAAQWHQPTHIYGFVRDMPRKMSAADILVTKAGPATICEACIAGLPMMLSDAIPGQETGNVEYVVENNAGIYAPTPYAIAASVRSWLAEGPAGLRRRAENARRLGRPDAVWKIAETVWEYAHRPPISTNRRHTFIDDLLEGPREIFPVIS